MLSIGFSNQIMLLPWGVVIGASLAAAVWDLRSRRIPNRLTVPVWVAGLAWGLWTDGLAGAGDSLAGCLLMGLPFVLLFALAGGGAGDAKLMMALGTWLGLHDGTLAIVMVCMAGAVMGLAWAVVRGRAHMVAANLGRIGWSVWFWRMGHGDALEAGRPVSPTDATAFPYGTAILAGVVLATAWRVAWP